MRYGLLVVVALACLASHRGDSCFDRSRTNLAQISAKTETACSDLSALGVDEGFGKREETEDPSSCEEDPAPPQLAFARHTFSNTSSGSHDMVLQEVPSPEWTQIRYMQSVQTPLDSMLGSEKEEEQIQECTKAERQSGEAQQASRRSSWGGDQRTGPMDCLNASSETSWCEEIGTDYGRWTRHALAPATNVASTSDQASCTEPHGRQFDDFGRAEDTRKSEIIERLELPFFARPRGHAGSIGEESQRNDHRQKLNTCAHQQTEQTSGQGGCSRKEDPCPGPRMVQVCSECAGPDSVPLSQIPTMQAGTVADLLGKEAGTRELQDGGGSSIPNYDGCQAEHGGATTRSDRCRQGGPRDGCSTVQCLREYRGDRLSGNYGSSSHFQRRGTGEGILRSSGSGKENETTICWSHITQSCGAPAFEGQEGEGICRKACLSLQEIDSIENCKHPFMKFDENQNWFALLDNPVSSIEHPSQTPMPRKAVTFFEQVEIVAWQEEKTEWTQVPLVSCERWLRNFWTLDGQISTWYGLRSAFQKVKSLPMSFFNSFALQGSQDVKHVSSGDVTSTQVQSGQVAFEGSQNLDTTSEQGSLSAIAFRHLCGDSRLPMYIETWFVASRRFRVCVESRKLRIAQDWNVIMFQRACRDLWVDLIGPDDFVWFRVDEPASTTNRQVKIIIAQGLQPTQMVSLLHYEGFPVMRKHRAILFENGIPALEVLRIAAISHLCQRDTVRCQIEYGHPWQQQVVNDRDPIVVAVPQVLHAKVLITDDSSEDGADFEIASEEGQQSTDVPTDGSDSELDIVSLMSLADSSQNLQPFPPAQPWEPPIVHLDDDADIETAEDDTIGTVDAQWDEILTCHGQAVANAEDSTFTVVTFGLGLVSLGRRDAAVRSVDVDVMLAAIADLWSDHAQYAPLRAILVRPQPQLQIDRGYIVFIVEVQYVPDTDPLRRRAILVRETGDPSFVREINCYPAWTGQRGNANVLLASIQRDADLYPHTVRRATVFRGENVLSDDRWIEFQDGDFCTVNFEPFPRHVTNAGLSVANAEALFLDLQFADERTQVDHAHCQFHGVSPLNVPLGARTFCVPLRSFIRGDWYAEARSLWPFHGSTCTLAYSWMENTASVDEEVPSFTFHFVVSYRQRFHQVPILVQQIIHAVEDSSSHSETWAIEVDSNSRPDQLPSILTGFRWWHNQADRRAHVHLRYPFANFEPGATVELTIHTHRRS